MRIPANACDICSLLHAAREQKNKDVNVYKKYIFLTLIKRNSKWRKTIKFCFKI